jgi:membrane protein implicated in regulation of membrane protease activity
MTWADFYLICFLIGFILSAVSFLAGSMHLHLPHLHAHHGGVPHVHASHGGQAGEVSPVNFGTATAFLAWFGGTGYLMTHYYAAWFLLGLAVAIVAGLTGAAVIFWFLAKVLISKEENLDPEDYSMVGVLGRVSSTIRAGGTGEMIFSQEGTRRTAGARSEDETAIPKGAEVVVTRFEKGIAYVRRWDDLAKEAGFESREERS